MPLMGYDIEADQGATFNIQFVWKQDDAQGNVTITDLTGYTARMQVRASPEDETLLADWTSSNGSIVLGGVAGTVQLVQSAEIMATFLAGSHYYDLELISPSGVVYRLLGGRFLVSRNITR